MVLNKFPRTNGEIIDADDMNQSFYQATFSPNLATSKISVDDTGTQVLASDPDRTSALIRNNGGSSVYIGDDSVTSTSGVELSPNENIYLETRGVISAVTSTGETTEIRTMVTSL